MSSVKQNVQSFFQKHGMWHGDIDMNEGVQTFLGEMEAGLKGQPKSLLMIPAFVDAGADIPMNEPVIVIDAGGTNFRVCLVTFTVNGAVIEHHQNHPMPGAREAISREKFFETIAEYLSPVLDRSSKIGFCFSYPTEIQPNGDGRLIRFSKEVRAEGVEGQLIGAGLLETLKRMGRKHDHTIVLLNDTVSTLLGGMAAQVGRKFDSYIGFILGTGTNTCYIERNSNITKVPGLKPDGTMIINIESGGYTNLKQGDIDRAYDATSVNPGAFVNEKMISGGYFGGLALWVLKSAAQEGLFSAEAAQAILALQKLTTKDVTDYVGNPYDKEEGVVARCLSSEDDLLAAYLIFDGLYERAARLVAISMAAVVRKTGRGSNPCKPVCVAAEGTMFSKAKLFRQKLDYYMRSFVEGELGLYIEYVTVENSVLLGTAIAGLQFKS